MTLGNILRNEMLQLNGVLTLNTGLRHTCTCTNIYRECNTWCFSTPQRDWVNESKQPTVHIYSTSTTPEEILTGEVDSKARLGDIKVRLELNGDDVESGVDPLRQERAANLLQRHLVLRRPVPHLQDVVGCLCVECKELETGRGEHKRLLLWLRSIQSV